MKVPHEKYGMDLSGRLVFIFLLVFAVKGGH